MSFVRINNLHVSCNGNKIIEGFDLSINEGEIYSVIGPSGCGKSTLLKAICGIIKPQDGGIQIKDEPANARIHNIGYIPQHYGLLDWLKVKDNIAIGEKIKHLRSINRDEIIAKLDISDLLDRYPRSLSGGQQQRVALARAWMLNPDILLMDEPFSALDAFTAATSKELFLKLWKQQKTTTIFVTHNVQEAVRLSKNIVILSAQPTRVVQLVRNPLFEKGASRDDDDFYFQTKEVSRIIKETWGAMV